MLKTVRKLLSLALVLAMLLSSFSMAAEEVTSNTVTLPDVKERPAQEETVPDDDATAQPSAAPEAQPNAPNDPEDQPVVEDEPLVDPSASPEAEPSASPEAEPSAAPEDEPEAEPSAEPEASIGTLYLTGDVYLRAEANGTSAALAVLKSGTAVEVLGSKGNWMKVRVDGQVGFVHSQWLTKDAPAGDSPAGDETLPPEADATAAPEGSEDENVQLGGGSSLGIMYVTDCETIYVREQPNASATVVAILQVGEAVEALELVDGWYHVRIGDREGYISAKYLTSGEAKDGPGEAPSGAAPEGAENDGTATISNTSIFGKQSITAYVGQEVVGALAPTNPAAAKFYSSLSTWTTDYYSEVYVVSGGNVGYFTQQRPMTTYFNGKLGSFFKFKGTHSGTVHIEFDVIFENTLGDVYYEEVPFEITFKEPKISDHNSLTLPVGKVEDCVFVPTLNNTKKSVRNVKAGTVQSTNSEIASVLDFSAQKDSGSVTFKITANKAGKTTVTATYTCEILVGTNLLGDEQWIPFTITQTTDVTVTDSGSVEPVDPTAPDFDTLEGLIRVRVRCNQPYTNHSSKVTSSESPLREGSYTIEKVADTTDKYTITIDSKKYVAAFDAETKKQHFPASEQKSVTVVKEGGTWQLADGSVSPVVFNITCGTPAPQKYTVTYTDGADDDVFADQTYEVAAGEETPAFNTDPSATVDSDGNPVREGYKFAGWEPNVADTVTDNVTYKAIWIEDTDPGVDEPAAPEFDTIKEKVQVAVNDYYGQAVKHDDRTYDLIESSYTFGGITQKDGKYYITMKLQAQPYVNAFTEDCGYPHERKKDTSETHDITFIWENDTWKPLGDNDTPIELWLLVNVSVVCTAPAAPTLGDLGSYDVKVKCTQPSQEHFDHNSNLSTNDEKARQTTFALEAGTFTATSPTVETISGKQVYVSKLTLTDVQHYVDLYNANASLADNKTHKRSYQNDSLVQTVYYDIAKNLWRPVINGELPTGTPPDLVGETFTVGVTCQDGNAFYGVQQRYYLWNGTEYVEQATVPAMYVRPVPGVTYPVFEGKIGETIGAKRAMDDSGFGKTSTYKGTTYTFVDAEPVTLVYMLKNAVFSTQSFNNPDGKNIVILNYYSGGPKVIPKPYPQHNEEDGGNVSGTTVNDEQFQLLFNDVVFSGHNHYWIGADGFGSTDVWITVNWTPGENTATMTFHGQNYLKSIYEDWMVGHNYLKEEDKEHRFVEGQAADQTVNLRWNEKDGKWHIVEDSLTWEIECKVDFTLIYNGNVAADDAAQPTGIPDSVTEPADADERWGLKSHTFTLDSAIPTREGYTFKGWSTTPAESDSLYQPGAEFPQTAKSIHNSATLYAIWEEAARAPEAPTANNIDLSDLLLQFVCTVYPANENHRVVIPFDQDFFNAGTSTGAWDFYPTGTSWSTGTKEMTLTFYGAQLYSAYVADKMSIHHEHSDSGDNYRVQIQWNREKGKWMLAEPTTLTWKMHCNDTTPDGQLEIKKEITSTPANGSYYVEGETITYKITVTNTGNCEVTSVTVIDKLISSDVLNGLHADNQWDSDTRTLKAGESMTYTTSYALTKENIAGKTTLTNRATVNGSWVGGDGTRHMIAKWSSATTNVRGTLLPPTVTKTLDDASKTYAEGDVVTWTIAIANPNNTPMTVQVWEAITGATLAIKGDSGATLTDGVVTVPGNSTVELTASYTVTANDVTFGKTLTNSVTVTPQQSTEPNSPKVPTDPVTGTSDENPKLGKNSLTGTKTVTDQNGVDVKGANVYPGDVLTYTVTITNGAAKQDYVAITDTFTNATGTLEGPTVSATSGTLYSLNGNNQLINVLPNDVITLTYTYTVQDADIGKTISNSVSARAGQKRFDPTGVSTHVVAKDANFTLEYKGNGADVTNVPGNDSYTGPENTHEFAVSTTVPQRAGYYFLGWSTNPQATEGSEDILPANAKVTVNANDTVTLYAVWVANAKFTVDAIESIIYDGASHLIQPVVRDSETGAVLVSGKDYMAVVDADTTTTDSTYTDAGWIGWKVTGLGKYSNPNAKTVTYYITPRTLTLSASTTLPYNGEEQSWTATVEDLALSDLAGDEPSNPAKARLVSIVDPEKFTVKRKDVGTTTTSYRSLENGPCISKEILTLADNHHTTAGDANKNYHVSISITMNITPATLVGPNDPTYQSSSFTVTGPENSMYDGGEHQNKPTIMDGNTTLVEGVDYTLSYSEDTTNVGTVTVTVTGTGNYTGSFEVTYQITKAPLTITAVDAEKTFGDPDPTSFGVTIVGLQGQDASKENQITCTVVRELGENVGSYTITPSEARVNGDLKPDNYDIHYETGTFTIHPRNVTPDPENPTNSPFTVTWPGNVEYDGTIHEQAPVVRDRNGNPLTPGVDYTVSYTGDTTNAGTVTVTVTGTGNYTGGVTGSYEITKRSARLASGSAWKTWDGSPLTSSSFTQSGFVQDEGVIPTITGRQTDVGSSPNTFTYRANANTDLNNYAIATYAGTLTVLPAANTAITITAGSAERNYDGTALSNDTVTMQGLPAGFRVQATTEGTITDAGSVENRITEYHIYAPDGTDVTASYTNVTQVAGTLTVNPRPVTLRSGSDSKVFDGQPLTSDVFEAEGFVEGQGVSHNMTGTQTQIGVSPNTFTYEANAGTNLQNYAIAVEYGTLTVTADPQTPITVTSDSVERPYDGTPLSAGNATATGLPEGYTVEIVTDSAVTNVGSVPNEIDGYVIRDPQGNDVTNLFPAATLEPGTLTITARALTIIANSAEKVFDGTALTDAGYQIDATTSLAQGDTLVSVTVTGSQTAIGSSPNVASAAVIRNAAGADMGANYAISYQPGTLTVQPRTFTLTINYWYGAVGGAVATASFNRNYTEGSTYNVASPTLAGYTANVARVTGTITSNTVLNVIYTANAYTLTVNYTYEDGTAAAPTYTATLTAGTDYTVPSPAIEGFTPNYATVAGNMPTRDETITVIYVANATDIVINEYGVPLNIGNVTANIGECFD